MREPIIFYCWGTFFYELARRSSVTGIDRNDSILHNFMTSWLREHHRRFGIKIFIIHLRPTQTFIEIRLFKTLFWGAKIISYQQKTRLCFLWSQAKKLSRTEEDREWLKFQWVSRFDFIRSFSHHVFPRVSKKNLFGKVHQEPENEKEKENSLERRKFYFSASFTEANGETSLNNSKQLKLN